MCSADTKITRAHASKAIESADLGDQDKAKQVIEGNNLGGGACGGRGTRGATTWLQTNGKRRNSRRRHLTQDQVEELLVNLAKKCWRSCTSPACVKYGALFEGGVLAVDHDVYLKLSQLSRPDLSSRGQGYDILLLDEAQDISPVIADIVLSQHRCANVLVKDTHQSIYDFRGAVDQLVAGRERQRAQGVRKKVLVTTHSATEQQCD
ncbi:unnamed protein product [Discosporangium mesarthrocarpum]